MSKTLELKIVWLSYVLCARLNGVDSESAASGANKVLAIYRKVFNV